MYTIPCGKTIGTSQCEAEHLCLNCQVVKELVEAVLGAHAFLDAGQPEAEFLRENLMAKMQKALSRVEIKK